MRSVKQIIDAAPADVELILVTRDRDLGDTAPYPSLSGRWIRRGRADIYYLNIRRISQWVSLIRQLRRTPISIMYVNSLWNPAFSIVPTTLALLRLLPVRRILIAPRGELSRGALGLKSFRKGTFLLVWARALRWSAPLWHASTELEAAEIRRATRFSIHRILISPDQVIEPRDAPPAPRNARVRFVFIGRISRKKNLKLIMQAFAVVGTAATLDVYGPIEDGKYWAECQAVIARLPAHVSIRYSGELSPDSVIETFSKYDAFVMPTLGENFGHAIAESLAASCPVICSDHTPWTPVLADLGGGEVVRELTPGALGAVLQRWAALTPGEIEQAHASARQAYVTWRDRQERTNIIELALAAEFRA
ncbi:MAG: hypothetical protein DLM58_13700 [Pseudonocardiales bacterium]|nr:MAG: hypothetical protein DLM58_13700 [Pseudonocardiales bacterium]